MVLVGMGRIGWSQRSLSRSVAEMEMEMWGDRIQQHVTRDAHSLPHANWPICLSSKKVIGKGALFLPLVCTQV